MSLVFPNPSLFGVNPRALIAFLLVYAIVTYGLCLGAATLGQWLRPVVFGHLVGQLEVDEALERFQKAHHARFAAMFLLNGENPRDLKKFQKLERKERLAWNQWQRLSAAYNWHEHGIDVYATEEP